MHCLKHDLTNEIYLLTLHVPPPDMELFARKFHQFHHQAGAIYSQYGILTITYVSFTSNEASYVSKSCLETPLEALVLTKEMPLSPPRPAPGHGTIFARKSTAEIHRKTAWMDVFAQK